ncbi:MAG: hypothetical protein DME42_05535 [Verrucomicrobia bacterium]|nr:MAG: hypothetical protein DME42_05535 [Verrucomicrobiota bacterium]
MFGKLPNTTGWQPVLPGLLMWEVMFWPIVACVLLPWLLVYLGLHVVQRGIIFVDIAMAQMASLGICVALLFRFDLHGWTTFAIALGFTILSGAIFSLTGKRASKIPQEAIIGIAYVVAAAAAVLLLSRAAEGDEEIKQMLVGNILLVTPVEVWKCFALFVAVGVFHLALRRNFLLVFRAHGRRASGIQLFDCAGGLWNQSRPQHPRPTALGMDHRHHRRNRRVVLVLLWRFTVRRGDCLHLRRLAYWSQCYWSLASLEARLVSQS